MDPDEVLVFVGSLMVACVAGVRWYGRLASASSPYCTATPEVRLLLGALPISLLVALGWSLNAGAAREVREDMTYTLLFLALGAAWLALTWQVTAWLGIGVVDDALERNNWAGTCIFIESKRFPLVWDALGTRLETWRRLLPASTDPRNAPWRTDDGWLLKTALSNTGDTVSIKGLMTNGAWAKVARSARWFPRHWVAQRRFETVALETPLGAVYPCIGVYTVAGRACGAYARVSCGPVVDYAAIDIALLIEDAEHDAVA